MRNFARTTSFGVAVAAIAAIGAAVQHPTVSILGQPGDGGGGGCSTTCENGHFGQGGLASDGKAQGTLFRAPSTMFGGETISGSGNLQGGRFWITNTGSASGRFDPGGPLERGHLSGIFGNCSGDISKC